MSAQAVESKTRLLDIIKQGMSVVFVILGIVAFYYFSELLLLYRVLMLVGAVILAIGILFTTAIGREAWYFILESKQEVRKVVWPTRDETLRTTGLVFLMVVTVGIFLSLLDAFLLWGIRLLTGQV